VAIKGGEFELLLEELRALDGEDADPSDTSDADKKIAAAANDVEVAKSFTVTLADGTKVEALDGVQVVKSLSARVERNEGAVMKALSQVLDIVKAGAAKIDKLARAHGVRVASASRASPEFWARALAAQAAGEVSAMDIAKAEVCWNKGLPIDPALVQKVDSAGSLRSAMPAEIEAGELLNKALEANARGLVSAVEISKAEAAINRGVAPDPSFCRKVLFGHSGTRA